MNRISFEYLAFQKGKAVGLIKRRGQQENCEICELSFTPRSQLNRFFHAD